MKAETQFSEIPLFRVFSSSFVGISTLDLNLLRTACSKIEILGHVNYEIVMFDAQVTVFAACNPTLKSVYVKAMMWRRLLKPITRKWWPSNLLKEFNEDTRSNRYRLILESCICVCFRVSWLVFSCKWIRQASSFWLWEKDEGGG